jgi:hypothetical protein
MGVMANSLTRESFGGQLAKLKRAKEHLAVLRDEGKKFRSQINIVPVGETGAGVPVLERGMPPLPFVMSLLASEIIHHIRSALDQSLTIILLEHGWKEKTQNANGKTIKDRRYFPSGKGEQKFQKSCTTNLKGLPKCFAEVIKGSNNYGGGNDDLYAVCVASNWDKHWDLVTIKPTEVSNGIVGITVSGPGTVLNIGSDENGATTVSGFVPNGGSITPNCSDAGLYFPITITGLEGYEGKVVIPMLEGAISAAECIISKLVECRTTTSEES